MKVKVYDNGGKTFDRITVVFIDQVVNVDRQGNELYEAIGAGETGAWFYLHCECADGPHLGERIRFVDLHPDLKERILQQYKIITDVRISR